MSRPFLSGKFSAQGAVFGLLLYVTAMPAFPQEATPPSDTVDLPTVLRLARDASPRLAIERQGIAGAEANRITAGAYPNPSISYGRFKPHGGQATLFDGKRQEQVTIELPLLIAGQRAARIEKAEREIEAARARVVSGASSLGAEAGSIYIALQAAQEKVLLSTAALDELKRLRNIVAGRAESGMASRYDLTRMEVELGTAQSRLDEARADIIDRSGQLAALLGLPGWRPQASGKLAPLPVPGTALANPRARAASSPTLLSALGEERAAQGAIEVARRERWPVPAFSIGRAQTSETFGSANFFGLTVEIPLLDSRLGPKARAEADAIAATMRRELTETEAASNLERYAGIITTRQAALQRHEQTAAERLPALRQMAEDAYRLGRGTVFDLLDATRSRQELQQTRIDLLTALADAQLRFLILGGELDRLAAPAFPAEPTRR